MWSKELTLLREKWYLLICKVLAASIRVKTMKIRYRNILLFLATVLLSALYFVQHGKDNITFYGDAGGYYVYLPTALIYHNVITPDVLPKGMQPGQLYANQVEIFVKERTPTGAVCNQYTYGVALMELPFFLVAHAYEKLTGKPANGYSDTYNMLIKVSSIVYAFLGLLLVYVVLKRYVNQDVAVATTIALFLGSNLFWFSLRQAGMSHVPLFFLYAALMYMSIRLYESPKWWQFMLIGAAAGTITIIRPTDIICLAVPLLYGVCNKASFLGRIRFIRTYYWGILLVVIAFVLPLLPQLLYWKAVSGHYLYYSYGSQSFLWDKPKIIEGLFLGQNGWLAYSPLLFFSLFGFVLYKSFKDWAWVLYLVFPVFVYVAYSWYCFNYINGLGSRPMIHIYPLLALPFAAFIQWIWKKTLAVRWAFVLISVFLVSVNINFSVQQAMGIMHSEESNITFNLQMLYRTRLRYKDLVVRDLGIRQPEEKSLTKLAVLGSLDYEDSVSTGHYKDTMGRTGRFFGMGREEYYRSFSVPYTKSIFSDARWLKCSGYYMYPEYADYCKHLVVIEMSGKQWTSVKVENKVGEWAADGTTQRRVVQDYQQVGTWGYVTFFVPIPKNLEDGDKISMLLWNTGKRPLFMDDLRLELYK